MSVILLVFGFVVLSLVAVWFSTLSKAFKDAATSDYVLHGVSPDWFGWLNRAELDAQTADLQSAGFISLGDFTTQKTVWGQESPFQAPIASPTQAPKTASNVPPPQGFVRVFVHPQHGCAANIITVYQEQPNAAPIIKPCQIALMSWWRTSEDDYVSYSTANHKPDVFADLHRNGRGLWTRKVSARAAELLEIHLRRREEIAPKIALPMTPFRDIEDYKSYERASAARLRAIYSRKNLFGATAQLALFKTTPLAKDETEWLGDFAAKA